MRARARHSLGVGQFDHPQQFVSSASCVRPRYVFVPADDLDQLAAHVERGIERRLRLLRDVCERAAAKTVEGAVGHAGDVDALDAHRARRHSQRRRKKPEKRERRDTLPRSRLSDEAYGLPRRD